MSTPVEIPIGSIRKLLEVTHESSKVIDYKIHIKKSTEFLYINNEKNRTENQKIAFKTASKILKYLE